MALEGNIQIGAPSAIPTPPVGEVTRFLNTDYTPARLYYKDSDGNVFPWLGADTEDCCCEIAENIMKDLTCAVKSGVVEMADFSAFILQGLNITGVKTDDGAGNETCSMSISSNAVAVTALINGTPTINPLAPAAQQTIVRTIVPANASNRDVFWASSDNGVATVSVNGIVTGVAPGSCVITGTSSDGGFMITTNVTVV